MSPLALDQWPPNMTYCERLLHINSYNSLAISVTEVTWQVKNIISPLSQCLWSQDYHGGDVPQGALINLRNLAIRWSCEVTWQIKYTSSCSRPMDTKLGAELQWEASIFKSTWSLIKWPTWGHVAIWKVCISTITKLIASKPGRVNLREEFGTQRLKSSLDFFSLSFSFSSLILEGLGKVFKIISTC